jgi:hypothetical protein
VSQLVPPPVPAPVPDWLASTPEWTGATGAASRGGWAPAVPAPVAPAGGAVRSRGPLALALVAAAGVVAGAVGGAFLVTAVFVGSAQQIGEGIGDGLAEGLASGMEDAYGPLPQDFGWSAGPPLDPADIGDPTPPVAGPDPVLDGYAQSCFEGVYPACDGLFFESPPMSDYEEYGATCGGRIEPYAVGSCTELD